MKKQLRDAQMELAKAMMDFNPKISIEWIQKNILNIDYDEIVRMRRIEQRESKIKRILGEEE